MFPSIFYKNKINHSALMNWLPTDYSQNNDDYLLFICFVFFFKTRFLYVDLAFL